MGNVASPCCTAVYHGQHSQTSLRDDIGIHRLAQWQFDTSVVPERAVLLPSTRLIRLRNASTSDSIPLLRIGDVAWVHCRRIAWIDHWQTNVMLALPPGEEIVVRYIWYSRREIEAIQATHPSSRAIARFWGTVQV